MIVSDSTMAYFVNQLDKFDETLNDPLFSVSWSRDIKLLPGVTLGTESTSFELTSYGYTGSQGATGKPWASDNVTALANVSVNGERIVSPINPLAMELSFSILEMQKSQNTGAPIDVKKTNGLQIAYQMNTDEMVYLGDTFKQAEGLINSTKVATGPVAGATWALKSTEEILEDVNTLLTSVWENTGYASCPDKLLLPPDQYAALNAQLLNTGTDSNVIKYLERNSICMAYNGRPLEIVPVKFLKAAGVGSTDRMVAYTNDLRFVRFPMAPIQRFEQNFRQISYYFPYIWAYGRVEFVYPETLQYADGI